MMHIIWIFYSSGKTSTKIAIDAKQTEEKKFKNILIAHCGIDFYPGTFKSVGGNEVDICVSVCMSVCPSVGVSPWM